MRVRARSPSKTSLLRFFARSPISRAASSGHWVTSTPASAGRYPGDATARAQERRRSLPLSPFPSLRPPPPAAVWFVFAFACPTARSFAFPPTPGGVRHTGNASCFPLAAFFASPAASRRDDYATPLQPGPLFRAHNTDRVHAIANAGALTSVSRVFARSRLCAP